MKTTDLQLTKNRAENSAPPLAPRQIRLHLLDVTDDKLQEELNCGTESETFDQQQLVTLVAQQLSEHRIGIARELLDSSSSYSLKKKCVSDSDTGSLVGEVTARHYDSVVDCEQAREYARVVLEVLWVTPNPYSLLADLGAGLTESQRESLNITVGGKTLPYLLRTKTQRLRGQNAASPNQELAREVAELEKLKSLFPVSQVRQEPDAVGNVTSAALRSAVQENGELNFQVRINLNICKPSASGNELGQNYAVVIYEYATGDYLDLPAREVQKEFNPQHLLRVLGCIRAAGALQLITTNDLLSDSDVSVALYRDYVLRKNRVVARYYRNYRELVVQMLCDGSEGNVLNADVALTQQNHLDLSNDDFQEFLDGVGDSKFNSSNRFKILTYAQVWTVLSSEAAGEGKELAEQQTCGNCGDDPINQLQLELVLGERGTGKTTLVQRVAREWVSKSVSKVPLRCIYATHLVSTYARQAELAGIEFIAYDELLQRLEQEAQLEIENVDSARSAFNPNLNCLWIIDEAAKVPVAVLERFLAQVRGKVILATTVSSYENSGVGLVHKLLGRKMLEQLARAKDKQALRIWLLTTNYRYPADYLSWCQQQLAGTCSLQELLALNIDYYLQRVTQAQSQVQVWTVKEPITTEVLEEQTTLGNLVGIGSVNVVDNIEATELDVAQLEVRQCQDVREIRDFLRWCYLCHYQTTPQDLALALENDQVKLYGLYWRNQLIGGCTLITEQAQVQSGKLILAGTAGNLALKLLNSQVAEFNACEEAEQELEQVQLQRISRFFLAPAWRKSRVEVVRLIEEFQVAEEAELEAELQLEEQGDKSNLGVETNKRTSSSHALSQVFFNRLVDQGFIDFNQLVILVGYEPALEKFWAELGCKLIYRTQETNSASGQTTAVFIHQDTQHPVLTFYANRTSEV